ncbi:MAG: gliding motility-associated C-terminal domain-containing protein [Bacteroidales bacterium]|nr:gliding motility-associated C-terminal domain-containing protein [Bacteroidales bacterium]MBN2819011.1 gliding motility-associated C-terminal domain-containing protein [Bacteroidales bacterium]
MKNWARFIVAFCIVSLFQIVSDSGISYSQCADADGGLLVASDTNLCSNQETTLILSEYMGTITWQWRNVGETAWTVIAGAIGDTVNVSISGTADREVRAYLAGSGCYDTSNTIRLHSSEFVEEPSIGNATTTCGDKITNLYADLATNTSYWRQIAGIGTTSFYPDSTDNAPDSIVVSQAGEYVFGWHITDGTCTKHENDTVIFYEQNAADAGEDIFHCLVTLGESFNLNATPSLPNTTGLWSGSGITILEPTNPNSPVQGNPSSSVYSLTWTEENGDCIDDDIVEVNIARQPLAIAGIDDQKCALIDTLEATPSAYPGNWLLLSGPNSVSFNNSNNYNAIITAEEYGEDFVFAWILTNSFCSDTDTVVIDFYEQPTTTAIDPDYSCGTNAQLVGFTSAKSGSVSRSWNFFTGDVPADLQNITALTDSTANIVIATNSYGNYTLWWKEVNGVCSDSISVDIDFYEQPEANAGPDTDSCGLDVLLNGSSSVQGSAIAWNNMSGISYNDITSPGSSVSSTTYGAYELIITETNESCTDRDTVLVNFIETPQANAGLDSSICGSSYILNPVRSIDGTTFSWDFINRGPDLEIGEGSQENPEITAEEFTFYDIILTETNQSLCSSADTVRISFFENPSPNAGLNDSICGTEYILSANRSISGSEIQWFTISGISFSSQTVINPTASLNNNIFDVYQFVLSETNTICSLTDTIFIEFVEIPNANAGDDIEVCGDTCRLNAQQTINNTTTFWSKINTNETIAIEDTTQNNSLAEAREFKTYQLVWNEINRFCNSTDTLQVKFDEIPQPIAGIDDSICGPAYTFSATQSISGSSLFWTDADEFTLSVFDDAHALDTRVTSSVYEQRTYILEETYEICSSNDTVKIRFLEVPTANGGIDGDTCGLSYELNAIQSLEFSKGQWSRITATDTMLMDEEFSLIVETAEPGTEKYMWVEMLEGCSDTAIVSVSYNYQPVARIFDASDACGLQQTIIVEESEAFTGNLHAVQSTAGIAPGSETGSYILEVSDTGEYNLNWYVQTTAGCSDDTSFAIHFYAEPEIFAGNDSAVCNNTISFSYNFSLGTGTWTADAGFSGDIETYGDSIVRIVTANYNEYTYTLTAINGACIISDNVIIDFKEPLDAFAGNDDLICGLEYALSATAEPGSWSMVSGTIMPEFSPDNRTGNAFIEVSEPGTYKLLWTAVDGPCTDTSSIQLEFVKQPVANAGEDTTLINPETVSLAANTPPDNETGFWTNLAGIGTISDESAANTRLVNFEKSEEGKQHVFLWTVNSTIMESCSGSDTIEITIYDIITPQIITPNEDGDNDVLYIKGIENLSPVEIVIFNRWGIEVYYSSDYQNDWDGTNKNSDFLANDTYFYILTLPAGEQLKDYLIIKR